jgi:pimeloyl-ACP methyl ester carboxylesterase
MGVSVGGALAADVAAVWPDLVDRLILVSPLGLFDEKEPSTDLFAQRPDQLPQLLCADPRRYVAHIAAPEGAEPVEWMVQTTRAREAAARLLWPLGDTGLASRLHRVTHDTLLLWGASDRVVPVSYRARFADEISSNVQVEVVEGAGHLVDLDVPAKLGQRVDVFLSR